MKLVIVFTYFATLMTITSLIIFQWIPIKTICNSYPVLLISMDGFRHDYIEKVKESGGELPNFDYLISQGSRIMRMENSFPTVTLPNHQTLLTGLYPENHGIIFNRFFDKSIDKKFEMNSQNDLNDKKWFINWPDPIWVTLQRLGYLTASHLWPLTDAPINEYLPFFQVSQYTLLNNLKIRFPFMKRVEDTVNWLSETQVHIDFAMLYFSEPDDSGHIYGPNDPHIYKAVMKLDIVLGYLIELMKSRGLWGKVNIILTADHGMSEVSNLKEIPLDDYLDPAWYTYIQLTPVGGLYPVKDKEQAVFNALHNRNPHLQVYWRHEVPKSLKFSLDNGRIPPVILIAENQWTITHKKSNEALIYGNHGYKQDELDAQSFFIAQGPNIRRNHTLPFGNSVDIYSLMCHLLKIESNPNNGSFEHIRDILKSDGENKLIKFLLFLKSRSWLTSMFIVYLLIILGSVMIYTSGVFDKRLNGAQRTNIEYRMKIHQN